MEYYIAQLFGIFGLIVMVISLFQKDKNKMLIYVIFNGIFFGIEYLFLGAYSGMLSNFFGIARTCVSKEKEKNEKLDKWYVLSFFLIGYIIIGLLTFDGKFISLLPIIAELIYVVTLWQKSVKSIRIGTLIMVILWLIYDIIVMAIPSAVTDLIVLTSTVIAIITKDILKKEGKKKKMKKCGTKKIETERLELRKMRLNDYKRIFDCWTSDQEVSKYVTWEPHKSYEETKQLVEYWVNGYNDENTYRWLVCLKKSKEVIGMIDVIKLDSQYKTAEVGYCYGSKYWGKGYGTEALKSVIEFLHNQGLAVVYAQHFVSNPASGKVMKKAGMEYEATLKSRVINNNNEREDVAVYSSIKD